MYRIQTNLTLQIIQNLFLICKTTHPFDYVNLLKLEYYIAVDLCIFFLLFWVLGPYFLWIFILQIFCVRWIYHMVKQTSLSSNCDWKKSMYLAM